MPGKYIGRPCLQCACCTLQNVVPTSPLYNLEQLSQHSRGAVSKSLIASCKPEMVLISTVLFQIEEEAVLLLAGLLKLSEAPARAQLQRVLLNLCAHSQTRKQVMQTLMSMLRAPLSADEAAEASQVCNLCVLPLCAE